MPTPDEVYEQVLEEERAKGSSPAVAEGRAKAARVRAQRGAKDPSKAVAATAQRPDATAAKPAAKAPTAGAPAKRAVGNGPAAVPERVQRLLAVVKPEAIQKVERRPMDRVNVWPHLMAAEFISLLVVTAIITFFSLAVDSPLRDLSNFNQTPNPSKAPWYFLGLQELLRYFHPQVAGVTIPTVLILVWFALPFLDRNPSTRPDDRKLAIVLFSFYVLSFAALTIIGMFFRGPGFNFVFPWKDGIFFEL
jgi:menaquinol-cytochrome c reductase cytochrome b/c subunit